jgi:hypothetical protein
LIGLEVGHQFCNLTVDFADLDLGTGGSEMVNIAGDIVDIVQKVLVSQLNRSCNAMEEMAQPTLFTPLVSSDEET